ncbi:hypothetical protein [Saccharospirillum mangrovi]|uniref:hypothetical protein n=1 Tax=Saccharospirillum mangrovi TaxID=2161747 RepID=UPI000D3D2D20|nr:hypothetical protein [Saccharospirillum mangrovi]
MPHAKPLSRYCFPRLLFCLVMVLAGCSSPEDPPKKEPPPSAPSQADTFTLGGAVVGSTGQITLRLFNSDEDLTRTGNGEFVFQTRLEDGMQYGVSIVTPPSGQQCRFANNTQHQVGTLGNGNVTNLNVTCSAIPDPVSISGSVTGLSGELGISLGDDGSNVVTLTSDSDFTFSDLAANASYTLTITYMPTAQQCFFLDGDTKTESLTVPVSITDVTDIQINCVDRTFSISGRVTGLSGQMDLNIKDSNGISHGSAIMDSAANTDFTFENLPANASYTLSVASKPDTQQCEFNNEITRTVEVQMANVSGITVTCFAIPNYTVKANISGWVGTGIGQLELTDDSGQTQTQTLDVSENGTFTFDTPLPRRTLYTVAFSFFPETMRPCYFGTNGANTTTGIQTSVTVTIQCSERPRYSLSIQGLLPPTKIVASVVGDDSSNEYTTNGEHFVDYVDEGLSITLLNDISEVGPAQRQICTFAGSTIIPTTSPRRVTVSPNQGNYSHSINCALAPTELTMAPSGIKTLEFRWPSDARFSYRLLERIDDPDPNSGDWTPIQPTRDGTGETMIYRHVVPLYALTHREYILETCYTDTAGKNHCQDSTELTTRGVEAQYNYLLGSIGYFKGGDETNAGNLFGRSVSLSDDGTVMAVGAYGFDRQLPYQENSGGVFIFRKTDGVWAQEGAVALVPNLPHGEAYDHVGMAVSLSGNGEYLAVGAPDEDGSGEFANPAHDNGDPQSGAVYVFHHEDGEWVQQAYLKPELNGERAGQLYGLALSLDYEGSTLIVGANKASYWSSDLGENENEYLEDRGLGYLYSRVDISWVFSTLIYEVSGDKARVGHSVSINGIGNTIALGAPQAPNNNAIGRGAVQVYSRPNHISAPGYLVGPTFIRSPDPTPDQGFFGGSVSVSDNGKVIAIGDPWSSRPGAGINPTQGIARSQSGSVYIYRWHDGDGWQQEVHIKAKYPGPEDMFGTHVSLSNDGRRLAVSTGADFEYNESPDETYEGSGEDSSAVGLNGNQLNNSAADSGAVYTYVQGDDGQWYFESYIKASNTAGEQAFGQGLSLSGDGNTLAVGAFGEDGDATGVSSGIGLDGSNTDAPQSGAVYLY